MAVRVDDATVFELDALVPCDTRFPDDTILLTDPIIVVEVESPTTQQVDVLRKFSRYFRNSAILNYLIILSIEKTVIHHRRTSQDRVESTSFENGVLFLDPPGLELSLDALFALEPAR